MEITLKVFSSKKHEFIEWHIENIRGVIYDAPKQEYIFFRRLSFNDRVLMEDFIKRIDADNFVIEAYRIKLLLVENIK